MSLNKEQLEAHYNGIGGSAASDIVGVGYLTPYERWQLYIDPEKREEHAAQLEKSAPVYWGTALEPVIAEWASAQLGYALQPCNTTLQHPAHAWMVAHPDRLVVGRKEGVEIKARSAFMARQYGDEGDANDVLESEIIQCQHYMAVTGYPIWHLAVLLGGQDARLFHVERDQGVIDALIEVESSFWAAVQDRLPPRPKTAREAQQLYPTSVAGKAAIAPQSVLDAVQELKNIKSKLKELEGYEARLQDIIKPAFEDAEVLEYEGRVIATWKSSAGSQKFNVEAFKERHPTLWANYLEAKAGSRRLLIKA